MLRYVRKLLGGSVEREAFTFARPLVALHSDDWGRVGVRDRAGFDLLRSRGLRLGERPYDLYTLETADDVAAVAELLRRHHDASGRSPCLMLHACTANLDFPRMRAEGFRRSILLPLSAGLPGSWSRPGLFDAYRAGIQERVFQPALHGSTHFCEDAAAKALEKGGSHAELLKTLWDAETPYIFWRMPWIGYEYWNPEYRSGFVAAHRQRELVRRACQQFSEMFGTRPISACAPGYRANLDTHREWAQAGIRVAVSGTGEGLKAPHLDQFGVLHLYRNVDFEPSEHEVDIAKYMELAALCFERGLPLVISIHSINFHSTLKDFRSSSVSALDRLLAALEARYPELLYVSDEDIYQAATAGVLADGSNKIKVSVTRHELSATLARIGAS